MIGPLSSAADTSEETVSAHNLFSDNGDFDGANIARRLTLWSATGGGPNGDEYLWLACENGNGSKVKLGWCLVCEPELGRVESPENTSMVLLTASLVICVFVRNSVVVDAT